MSLGGTTFFDMTRTGTLLATIAILATTACTPDEPADGDTTRTPTPAATTSTPAASPSPTPAVTAPTMPPAARKHNAQGAAAFVEYFYATMRYAATTGHVDAILAISHKSCEQCTMLAKNYADLYASGGKYGDLPWIPTITTAVRERDHFTVLTDVNAKRYSLRENAAGPVITIKPKRHEHLIHVRNTKDGWKVLLLANQPKAKQ